jgi:hypothetical protein
MSEVSDLFDNYKKWFIAGGAVIAIALAVAGVLIWKRGMDAPAQQKPAIEASTEQEKAQVEYDEDAVVLANLLASSGWQGDENTIYFTTSQYTVKNGDDEVIYPYAVSNVSVEHPTDDLGAGVKSASAYKFDFVDDPNGILGGEITDYAMDDGTSYRQLILNGEGAQKFYVASSVATDIDVPAISEEAESLLGADSGQVQSVVAEWIAENAPSATAVEWNQAVTKDFSTGNASTDYSVDAINDVVVTVQNIDGQLSVIAY